MDLNKLRKNNIYANTSRTILGFHGCEKETALKVLNMSKRHLSHSKNDYDWLGSGIYFWENDPIRAFEWAKNNKKFKDPFVIGAIIDLGRCLNLCERDATILLQDSYKELKEYFDMVGINFNEKYKNEKPDIGGFNIKRNLDCKVINNVCTNAIENNAPYDTVCGYFLEGAEVYPGTEIREKTHIQIAVRNDDCIKGYFLPRI